MNLHGPFRRSCVFGELHGLLDEDVLTLQQRAVDLLSGIHILDCHLANRWHRPVLPMRKREPIMHNVKQGRGILFGAFIPYGSSGEDEHIADRLQEIRN